MAVIFDAIGTEAHLSVGTDLTDSSLTIGTGPNRALIVAVRTSTLDPGSITVFWDAFGTGGSPQQLTLIDSFTSASSFPNSPNTIQLYGLIAPRSGNLTLEINTTSSTEIYTIGVSFTGVLQTGGATTFANGGNTTGTSATATKVVSSATGDVPIAQFLANGGFFIITSVSGTEIYHEHLNDGASAANYAPGAASVSMTATLAGSTFWAAQGFNLVAAPFDGPPLHQPDWPLPPRRRAGLLQHWQNASRLPLLLAPTPPRQPDWPNPRGWPYRAVGFIDTLKFPLVSAYKPFNETDWPNPQRPLAWSRVPADWVTGSTWPLTQPLPELPARTFDWPNPRGPLRKVEDFQLSYVQIAILPPPDITAQTRQLDWPNPTLRKPPVVVDWQQSSTWILSQPVPDLTTQARQLDWPNPPRARPPLVQDWLNPLWLFQPAVLSFDWPNPSLRRPPLLRDWVQGSTAQLTAPSLVPPPHQLDWPNPNLGRRPIVRDWVAGSTRTVTAPPPVMPMARPRDWPNPRGAKPNQALGRINSSVVFALVPPQAPRETLANRSGRVRFLKNEVGRVRWLQKL